MIKKRKYDIVDIEKFGSEYQFFKELLYLLKKHNVSISPSLLSEESDTWAAIEFEFPQTVFIMNDNELDCGKANEFERIYPDDEEDLQEKITLSSISWTKEEKEKADNFILREED